ncbi:MAG: SGNH/GDSL hydrolase family protein [Desulfobacteraceae bacterium]|nr:MAG: SGNH/GDSL hydrolase family protein [Desulfobacteraceae bacterium]
MNRKERIVVIGDSLPLPRIDDDNHVLWDKTWPYLLHNELNKDGNHYEVINCSIRSRTIETVTGHDFNEHILWKKPDIIILQVGIVDCAPRIFSRKEKLILGLSFIPDFIRQKIIKHRSQKRKEILRKNPLGKVYTKPEEYHRYIEDFFVKIKSLSWEIKIIILPILSNSILEEKSPGHNHNAQVYNDILKDACIKYHARWIDPEKFLQAEPYHNLFCADGYHLDKEGNRYTANLVMEALQQTHQEDFRTH